MMDGCECVSAWSWLALGCLIGVLATLSLAAVMSARQFAREGQDE
jgi:hypothetical protein